MITISASFTRIFRKAALIMIILSCNNEKKTQDETAKENSMDTIRQTGSIQHRIGGQAGSIFIDDGGKNGLPVVLVHSFGGNTSQWDEQLSHLRKSRRAIAFDLRGHGNSESPENGEYTVQALSNDLAAVVDSLSLKEFVLIGHSMGGSAAIDYVARNPEKVKGIMLVGTPGKSSSKEYEPILSSLESDKYDTVMNQYMARLLKDANPSVSAKVREGMKKLDKQESISFIKAVFQYDPLPGLSAYPGPKMIIATPMEEQINSLSKQLPDIPHKTIQGTSHWIQMDKPKVFNQAMDEFLRTVDSVANR